MKLRAFIFRQGWADGRKDGWKCSMFYKKEKNLHHFWQMIGRMGGGGKGEEGEKKGKHEGMSAAEIL